MQGWETTEKGRGWTQFGDEVPPIGITNNCWIWLRGGWSAALLNEAVIALIVLSSIILDYAINIKNLKRKDQMFDAGALGNFSLAGFEMVI